MTRRRRNIFNMLAIIKVLENLLNFFSLALNNRVTRVKVIPAKSNSNRGQNLVIALGKKNEITNPVAPSNDVNIVKFRIKRLRISFIKIAVI
jgi:hypothetical protein